MSEIYNRRVVRILILLLIVLAGAFIYFGQINVVPKKKEKKSPTPPKSFFIGVITNQRYFHNLGSIQLIKSYSNPDERDYVRGYDSRKIEIHFVRKSLLDSILMNFTKYSSIQYLKLSNIPGENLFEVISKFNNLVYLQLEGCQILKPNEFFVQLSKIKDLSYLDIHDCNIVNIPDEISLLKNLLELKFAEDSIRSIPESIGELVRLEYLSLNGKIANFPETIGRLIAMKEIDFSSNPVERFPPQIYNMKLIESINLASSKIAEIPEELSELKFLRKICLVDTKVQDEIAEGKYLEWQISELKKKSNIRVFFNFYDDPMEKLR